MSRPDDMTKQELADWNNRFGEEKKPFDKFDQILLETQEQSLKEKFNLEVKGMISFKLHKTHIEIRKKGNISSFLYYDNPVNSYIVQLIKNKFKDKEEK